MTVPGGVTESIRKVIMDGKQGLCTWEGSNRIGIGELVTGKCMGIEGICIWEGLIGTGGVVIGIGMGAGGIGIEKVITEYVQEEEQ